MAERDHLCSDPRDCPICQNWKPAMSQSPGAVEALESILAICNEAREARDLQPRMTEIRSIARASLAALHPQPAPAVAVEALVKQAKQSALAIFGQGDIRSDLRDLNEAIDALAARSAPAVAEKVPLTVLQYNAIPELGVIKPSLYESIVRAIERAHGIGSGSAQEGQAK